MTREERSAWVVRWEGSGQSAREFARAHGLGVSTLLRWRRGRREVAAATPGLPALREVSLGGVLTPAVWVAEVRRPDGLTVRLSAEAPRGLVKALLATRSC